MTSCSTICFLIGILLTPFAGFLALGAMKMETFSRARLRKLRESNKDQAEALEKLLPVLPRLRLCNHLELLFAIAATIACFTLWHLNSGLPHSVRWAILTALFLATYLTVQALDMALSLRWSALVLRLAGLLAYPVLYCFAFLIYPLGALEQHIQHATGDENNAQVTAEDEILSLVEEDAQAHPDLAPSAATPVNDLEIDEKRMLNGVINLDKTLVHEIMTPRVDIDAIEEQLSVAEAKKAFSASGHSRIPLISKSVDAIIGILYAKDFLDEEHLSRISSLKELAHPPVFIPDTKNVSDLLEEFRAKHLHLAVVLDEYGGTAGIVTFEDILEEIVGEIQDEFDRDEVPANRNTPQADGSMVADARMTIWELNQLMDMEISEEEGYDTLGGYIMATLGRIPQSGEHLETEELSIDILAASPRRLDTVKIRRRDGRTPSAATSHQA
ncbi:MAG: HlyC/CorC family transporter [Victivallales bacterium]|nr:HlyC/CorC family transporter [Victivallales bacterium]